MVSFQKNYGIYYSMLCITGLWPFYQSTLSKIQRTFYSVCTLCCIVVQVSSIQNVELTLDNLLRMLSFTCPMALFLLRYLCFIYNFSILETFIHAIENDCNTLKNSTELRILMKRIEESKNVILIYLGMSCTGIFMSFCMFVVPTFLHSKHQLYYLHNLGFYFVEQNRRTDWVCLNAAVTTCFGLLAVACTEASFSVFCLYLCGLYEIVSYRIRTAVDNGAKCIQSKPIDIRPAVNLHQKALKLGYGIARGVVVSYLAALLMVVCSFAVNLYRIFLLLLEMKKIDEIVISIVMVASHFIIMFVFNHDGQKLVTSSGQLFHQTYDSLWYYIPLKTQKVLLFILTNTTAEVQINLAGLFVPSFQGFSRLPFR
ncbi:uncharacterized protein LOC143174887 isoform X2 [Nomia melanderi]|uniref:uncharacterized protein LOC143174887 isoform X2 n=1 Tax=Nomia melanderi TaxID=2448451 RepID=UPI003FCCB603